MDEEARISKDRLSATVVKRIIGKISVGELKAGDVLPSERKLASDMGVSRTVIREALAQLHDDGLIEINEGICSIRLDAVNIMLNKLRDKVIPDKQTAAEVMEIRMILEEYSARKAALNGTDEEIKKLDNIITKMRNLLNQGSISYDQETAFHTELIKTAHNSMLNRIYAICGDLLSNMGMVSLFTAKQEGIDIVAVNEHQAILDAIKSRDADKAGYMMDAHLEYARQNLLKACEKEIHKVN